MIPYIIGFWIMFTITWSTAMLHEEMLIAFTSVMLAGITLEYVNRIYYE